MCELRELRMAKGTIKEKCLRWPLSKTKIEAIPLTLGIHKHIRTRAHTQDLTCTHTATGGSRIMSLGRSKMKRLLRHAPAYT